MEMSSWPIWSRCCARNSNPHRWSLWTIYPRTKVAGVQQLIAATGARLIYLPPYSPDFNPIEQAWSKIKQLLRSAKARTVEALESAITQALAAVTAENALAWFSHCGYGLQ